MRLLTPRVRSALEHVSPERRLLRRPLTSTYNSVAAGAAMTGGSVQLAAFGTGGLEGFLKGDALQVGILVAGLVILYGAKRKDWSGTLMVGGIALVGMAVMGMATKGMNIGDFLAGWIWTDSKS
ncbi:hypothetical protein [Streptomyces lunalinharesii]|uniref:Uncharacterized protein n=1 Tax=Streptomyces lunalinharesii TaxID=333384 RepID=A0ABN3SVF9_9ACTN